MVRLTRQRRGAFLNEEISIFFAKSFGVSNDVGRSGKGQICKRSKDDQRDMMDVREFNLGRLQVQRRYLAELDNEIMAAQSRLRDLHSEHQKALNEYVEAQKERKVLEKLRDKQKEDYQLEANHEEQKQLDEMANRPKYKMA